MKMSKSSVHKGIAAVSIGLILFLGVCARLLKWRGFRASSTPSSFETAVARSLRNFAIPVAERNRTNPVDHNSTALLQGREDFLTRCASCHGVDARGLTPIGANVYPRVPDLHLDATQQLSDGEIHYIIENGIELTGMP